MDVRNQPYYTFTAKTRLSDPSHIYKNPTETFNNARGFGIYEHSKLEWELGVLWMWSEVALEAPEDMPAGSTRASIGGGTIDSRFWRGE